MTGEKEISGIFERRERKRLFSELQASAERDGMISRMPFLLMRAMVEPFRYAGGLLIGVLLGTFVLLFNFLLFVWVLHMEF